MVKVLLRTYDEICSRVYDIYDVYVDVCVRVLECVSFAGFTNVYRSAKNTCCTQNWLAYNERYVMVKFVCFLLPCLMTIKTIQK